MAIENLVSNLHDFDIPVSADEAAWLQEQVVQLGVGARTAEFVSQLKIGDTTASGSAAGSETGPDIDIAGLASTLLGMDREAVDGLIDQAKAGMQERLSTLRGAVDGLDSDDPTARAKAEEAVREIERELGSYGVQQGTILGQLRAGRHDPVVDLDEGRALLAEGLQLLSDLAKNSEGAADRAQAFATRMEGQFGHLVPDDDPLATQAELKAHVRSEIAAALKDLKL